MKQVFRPTINRLMGLLMKRVNITRVVRINDKNVSIPMFQGLTVSARTEPWMSGLIAHLYPIKAGIFIDIGVNMGQTLIKLKTLFPQAEYIGVEPNPTCLYYVKQLIAANGFTACKLVPVGVFDRDGLLQLQFFSQKVAAGSASLIDNFHGESVYQELVPVLQFDTIASVLELGNVGIVKIDVEGAELEVIESLDTLLRVQRPILTLEVLPVYSPDNTDRKLRQEEIEDKLSTVNYDLFRVHKSEANTFLGLQRIERIGIHSNLSLSDYVAAPRELRAQIENGL